MSFNSVSNFQNHCQDFSINLIAGKLRFFSELSKKDVFHWKTESFRRKQQMFTQVNSVTKQHSREKPWKDRMMRSTEDKTTRKKSKERNNDIFRFDVFVFLSWTRDKKISNILNIHKKNHQSKYLSRYYDFYYMILKIIFH